MRIACSGAGQKCCVSSVLGKSRGLLNVLLRGLLGLDGPGPFDIFSWYGMILAQGLSEMGQASALAVIMAVILLAVGGLARRFVGTRLGTCYSIAYRVPYPLLRSKSGILLETRRISRKPT